jgi:hypothetical protein
MPESTMEDYLRGRLKVELLKLDRLRAVALFPLDLQGPPAAGHGGGTTGLLFEMVRMVVGERGRQTLMPRPLRIEVALQRELPLATPLRAEVEPADGGWVSRLRRDDTLIAEARVLPGVGPLCAPTDVVRSRWQTGAETGELVPGYEWCLGCGFRNPRGAQVRFEYNADFMWKRLHPLPHFRNEDGSLATCYACIVGDELGWWLGALRQGECGLSSRIAVTLGAPVAYDTPLLALGDRTAVAGLDAKGRIWRTQAFLLTPDWEPVAVVDVQFAGSRAFTKLMLPGFVIDEDVDGLRRAFPLYAETRKSP